MTNVLGRGLSVFISWHSVGRGRTGTGGYGDSPAHLETIVPKPPAVCWPRARWHWGHLSGILQIALDLPPWGSRSGACVWMGEKPPDNDGSVVRTVIGGTGAGASPH